MGYINNLLYLFNKNINQVCGNHGYAGWQYDIERHLTPRQFGEALNERRNKYGRSNNKRKRNR